MDILHKENAGIGDKEEILLEASNTKFKVLKNNHIFFVNCSVCGESTTSVFTMNQARNSRNKLL